MDSELIRLGREAIKRHFVRWRDPPVELPADSVIDVAVTEVLSLASVAQEPVTADAMFRYLSAAVRVLHELSVRITGGGFTLHDIGGEGLDIHSSMTRPIRVTFDSEVR